MSPTDELIKVLLQVLGTILGGVAMNFINSLFSALITPILQSVAALFGITS
jgi:hypothetical protein